MLSIPTSLKNLRNHNEFSKKPSPSAPILTLSFTYLCWPNQESTRHAGGLSRAFTSKKHPLGSHSRLASLLHTTQAPRTTARRATLARSHTDTDCITQPAMAVVENWRAHGFGPQTAAKVAEPIREIRRKKCVHKNSRRLGIGDREMRGCRLYFVVRTQCQGGAVEFCGRTKCRVILIIGICMDRILRRHKPSFVAIGMLCSNEALTEVSVDRS